MHTKAQSDDAPLLLFFGMVVGVEVQRTLISPNEHLCAQTK
jgi:hypothetical protein